MKDYTLDQIKYDRYGNIDVAYYAAEARKLRSAAASEQVNKAVDALKNSFAVLTMLTQQPKAA